MAQPVRIDRAETLDGDRRRLSVYYDAPKKGGRMAQDVGVVDKLMEVIGQLSPEDRAKIMAALGNGATDRDDVSPNDTRTSPPPADYDYAARDEVTFGPADPGKAPPPPMSLDEIKSYLKERGISQDDIRRMFPSNAAETGLPGGRMAEDSLVGFTKRTAPGRGEGFSVPQYNRDEPPAASSSKVEADLDRMFGTGRIGRA